MAKVKFSKYENEIVSAIQKLKDEGYFDDSDKDSLLINNTFSMIPAQEYVGEGLSLGTTTPAIQVVSAKTGRMYFFSLKILLPKVFQEAFENE